MGLDMYLYIRKNEYCSKYYKDEGSDLKLEYPKDVSRFFPNLTDLTISRTTDYKVGYWIKANAIHSWFLENCAAKDPFDNPIDDCRPIEIPLEKLEELLDTCKEVLEDHSLAKRLLPTADGFFFGSTKYDEWYFNNIEETINIIEPVIDFMKHMSEIKDCTWDVIYEASW